MRLRRSQSPLEPVMGSPSSDLHSRLAADLPSVPSSVETALALPLAAAARAPASADEMPLASAPPTHSASSSLASLGDAADVADATAKCACRSRTKAASTSRTTRLTSRPVSLRDRSGPAQGDASPDTPLARVSSREGRKRSKDAIIASQHLYSAVHGPPPPVLSRTSSLRRRPSLSCSVSSLPQRTASTSSLALSSARQSPVMSRAATESSIASGLSQVPSRDSEAFGDFSFSTASSRTSASAYAPGRDSLASSTGLSAETDYSLSPVGPLALPDDVGLGISSDFAVDPLAGGELPSRPGHVRHRSRSSSAAYDRPGSRWSRASTGDRVVRSEPSADVADLLVPADTTHLVLVDTSGGLDALLSRVLPQLAALVHLDLSRNRLRVVPAAVVACAHLQELLLNDNYFDGGALPALLVRLTSLRVLGLDGCGLTSLPTSLAPLEGLRALSLRDNGLKSLPGWLAHLAGLETLILDGNPFTPHWAKLLAPLLNAEPKQLSYAALSRAPRADDGLRRPPLAPHNSAVATPPLVNTAPLAIKKMRSTGNMLSPPAGLADMPSASADSMASQSFLDTVATPGGLSPMSELASPMEHESPASRRKGFFGSLGRRKASNVNLKQPAARPSTADSKSSADDTSPRRFLLTPGGLRRNRTVSTQSSASSGSPVSATFSPRPAVSPVTPATPYSGGSFISTAESASSRPTTASSIRRTSARTSGWHPMHDDEREVLATPEHARPQMPADPKAGLRMLMAYLRDLDDLTPQAAVAGPSRSRPASRASTTSRPVTPHASRGDLRRVDGSSASLSALDRPAHADVKLKDDAQKRRRVIEEIVATEQSYVKGLDELVEIYVRPAAELSGDAPVVPVAERRAVFSNIEDILRFHLAFFLPDLQTAAAPLKTLGETTDDQRVADVTRRAALAVADVFDRHGPYLKIYSTYITGFDSALARFQSWTKSSDASPPKSSSGASAKIVNAVTVAALAAPGSLPGAAAPSPPAAPLTSSQRKKLKSYLKHCRAHPKHSQISCESYLLLPVQRIPRYKMLLEALLGCTPRRAPGGAFAPDDRLVAALALASGMANDMNERKRESEGRKKLLAWQSRIGTARFRSPLVQPHRLLLREGAMTLSRVVKRSTAYAESRAPLSPDAEARPSLVQVPSLAIKSEDKALVALLCSDILVLVYDDVKLDGTQELYTVVRPVPDRAIPPATAFGGDGMLRLVDVRAVIYLQCGSTAEAESWADAINARLAVR